MTEPTSLELIEEYLKVRDHLTTQNKAYAEYVAPHKERMSAIENILLDRLNKDGAQNVKTDAGTAYKQTGLAIKVDNRDQLIDFCMDKWDDIGSELLMVSAQKDAVRDWMQANNGTPPPGVSTEFSTYVNIRRS